MVMTPANVENSGVITTGTFGALSVTTTGTMTMTTGNLITVEYETTADGTVVHYVQRAALGAWIAVNSATPDNCPAADNGLITDILGRVYAYRGVFTSTAGGGSLTVNVRVS